MIYVNDVDEVVNDNQGFGGTVVEKVVNEGVI